MDWEGPFPVFRPDPDFWSDRNFWAPEVYQFNNKYFMFASFKAPEVCRGTQILVADTPLGPFMPFSKKPVTPSEWECLDGTLYISPEGDPWMVFCHEWVQIGDGEICAIPLNKGLTNADGVPITLFSASEAAWTQPLESKGRRGIVTDGPWMHSLPDGQLLILWSSLRQDGYTVGIARSPSGQLQGPWLQDPKPLFDNDGGHCMTFHDFDENLFLCLHHPNPTPLERPILIPLDEKKLMKSQ